MRVIWQDAYEYPLVSLRPTRVKLGEFYAPQPALKLMTVAFRA